MRSNSQKVCCHFVLGISFMVAAAASGAPRGDRLPPPDKDPSARGTKVTVCHRAPDGRFSPINVSPSSLNSHLNHGDCHIDDGIACTSDRCDRVLGCVHTPRDSRCDDGLFCTTEHCEPASTSEDFAYMLLEKPGCYIWLGNGDAQHSAFLHHPLYDFNDSVLTTGTRYWVKLVESLLPA